MSLLLVGDTLQHSREMTRSSNPICGWLLCKLQPRYNDNACRSRRSCWEKS